MGPSRPGQLVDPAGTRTWARVERHIWSLPWANGPKPEMPGTSVRHREASGMGSSRLRQLVTPRALVTGPKTPGNTDRTRGLSDASSSRPRQLFKTRAFGHGPESPGSAGGPCGPSGTGLRRPGSLVDTACTQTRSRITWNSWSTPWDLGPRPNTPGTASRPCWTEGMGPSGPNHRSTSRALGHETE